MKENFPQLKNFWKTYITRYVASNTPLNPVKTPATWSHTPSGFSPTGESGVEKSGFALKALAREIAGLNFNLFIIISFYLYNTVLIK